MNNTDSARQWALLAIVTTAVLWSLGGVLIKAIDWHPAAIAGIRSAIAAVVLACLFHRRLRFPRSPYIWAGALAYAIMMITFVAATKLTTAANAIFLQYTAPIYVALFSRWFLNEPVTRRDGMIIAATVFGMSLFFVDRLSFSGFWGNLAAIGSGVAFAWTCMLVRKAGEASVEPLLLGNILAALMGLPFIFGDGPGWSGWMLLLVLGVFQLGMAYACFSYAVRHLPALEITLISTIEPILNPIWVLLFLGEKPGIWAMVGGAIVLVCVTFKGVTSFRQPLALSPADESVRPTPSSKTPG
ncbi:MAG: DMT family transporter [Gammaproteobacteria bacterium]|nr:DMT family transporter [Gammaproteobacteria bacterium]MCP5423464.1 DMT family transporter [Gammaproteobacteria bacterium]MCP5458779.1 DMT family transporter [Gammaproteobacteria bacterium]